MALVATGFFCVEEIPLCSGQLRQNGTCRDPSREDAGAKESPFQSSFAVNSGESGQLSNRIQSWNGSLLAVEDSAVQVDRDASHALTC